jgi:uncharacterized protein (TIGR03435 family)
VAAMKCTARSGLKQLLWLVACAAFWVMATQAPAQSASPAGEKSSPAPAAPGPTLQPETAAPAKTPVNFEIADIHPSPRRRYAFFDGAFLQNGRYILRQATMADLISTAYGLKDSSYVRGGPPWLEWDRWEVIGKVPPETSEATAKQMLQSLLAQRFGLVVHTGSAPMPAWVLRAGKDTSKLKRSSDENEFKCSTTVDPPNPTPASVIQITAQCRNMTMDQFAERFQEMAGGYLDKPVVNSTGLDGQYDLTVHWTARGSLPHAGADGISFFDAADKQLGLKLTLETAPRPALIVDSGNETPTPNAPDLAKVLPPLPPAQFEVATIKPSAPDEPTRGKIAPDEVNLSAFSLRLLINIVWDLDANDKGEIVGAPKWLDSAKIDVQAKVANNLIEGAKPGRAPIPFEDVTEMLKALLIERFEMKVHMENQVVDAYDLVAVKPKLTPADPTSRTNCHSGPGPDGKDPRTAHPIFNMLETCQNVTMAQAGEVFPSFAAYYLYYPAVDKTGLKGGWDFTLNWSSGDNMPGFNGGGGGPQAQNPDKPSDPNGALSFYDAVSQELGLKLVKVKRLEPVLVIDHMDEQPTPN